MYSMVVCPHACAIYLAQASQRRGNRQLWWLDGLRWLGGRVRPRCGRWHASATPLQIVTCEILLELRVLFRTIICVLRRSCPSLQHRGRDRP